MMLSSLALIIGVYGWISPTKQPLAIIWLPYTKNKPGDCTVKTLA